MTRDSQHSAVKKENERREREAWEGGEGETKKKVMRENEKTRKRKGKKMRDKKEKKVEGSRRKKRELRCMREGKNGTPRREERRRGKNMKDTK